MTVKPMKLAQLVITVAAWALVLFVTVKQGGVIWAVFFAGLLALLVLIEYWPSVVVMICRESWADMAVIVGVLSLTLTSSVTDSTGSQAFYSTAAQVIPVLLLVLALEVRLVPRNVTGVSLRMAVLAVVLTVAGEVTGLQALDRGRGGTTQLSATVAALAVGLTAVSLIALGAVARNADDLTKPDETDIDAPSKD